MLIINAATVVYCASLLLALLNYGASDLLTVTLLAIPVCGSLTFFLIFRELPKHTATTFYISAVVLVFSIGWMMFQTTSLPGRVFAHPAWTELVGLGSTMGATVSATPADDWAGFMRIGVPFGVFLCGLFLFPTDERAVAAISAISVVGGIFALLSIGQFVLAPDTLLFSAKTVYRDSLTGMFVNRNTAATFFGLLVLLQCSMAHRAVNALEVPRILAQLEGRHALPSVLKREIWWASFYSFLLLLCLTALMLTKSRAGIGSTFAAVSLLAILMMTRPANRAVTTITRYGRPRKILVVTAAASMIFLGFSMSGRALWRAEVQGFDDGRFCVIPGILAAVKHNFPQGMGLSSFIEVFPAYRDPRCGTAWVWDMAHNFYLEGVLAFGAAFVFLAGVVVVWLGRIFVVGLRTRRRFRFGAEIGAASLVLVIVHSAFDFSLQISGFAIFYAALLAPVTTLCLCSPGRDEQRGRRRPKRICDKDDGLLPIVS